MEIIQIKCPNCGAKLRAKMVEGIEKKSPICPVCKEKSPFNDYIKVSPNANEGATDYGAITKSSNANEIGQLRVVGDPENKVYKLKEGKNIVGRKATTTNATLQLEMPAGGNRVSREHFIINVNPISPHTYRHSISLYKQQVNETFVGDIELEYGICLVLKHGDLIRIPGMTLRFECQSTDACDSEETIL